MQHSSSSRSLHWHTLQLFNLPWPSQAPQLNTPSSCQKRRGNMVLSNALNFSTISLDEIHQHQTQPLDRQCCSAQKKRTFEFPYQVSKWTSKSFHKIEDLTKRPHWPLHLSVLSNQYNVAMCLPNIPKGNYSCSYWGVGLTTAGEEAKLQLASDHLSPPWPLMGSQQSNMIWVDFAEKTETSTGTSIFLWAADWFAILSACSNCRTRLFWSRLDTKPSRLTRFRVSCA